MKKLFFAMLLCVHVFHVLGQDSNRPPRKQTKGKDHVIRPNICSSLYLTLSTGLNNNTGIGGFSLDIPIEKFLSVDLGAGVSSWGYKGYIGGKYYLQTCHRGWAFGTGLTYNTGMNGFQQSMATVYGNEAVKLNLNSRVNILFAAYKYWNLGKRYNRFFVEMGWSAPLGNSNVYQETNGDPLTSRSDKDIKLRSPGGVIAAAGFSFSVR